MVSFGRQIESFNIHEIKVLYIHYSVVDAYRRLFKTLNVKSLHSDIPPLWIIKDQTSLMFSAWGALLTHR